jgi:hypothetical protein
MCVLHCVVVWCAAPAQQRQRRVVRLPAAEGPLGFAVLSRDIVSSGWERPAHMPRAAEVCRECDNNVCVGAQAAAVSQALNVDLLA